MTVRGWVVVGLVAAGMLAGCGSNQDCSVTPPLQSAPASCTAGQGGSLQLRVNWCDCNAGSIGCNVSPQNGGVIQVEPVLQSCDASCPVNPVSCGALATTCTVPVPSTPGPYNIYVFGAQNANGYELIPLTVTSGGPASCS